MHMYISLVNTENTEKQSARYVTIRCGCANSVMPLSIKTVCTQYATHKITFIGSSFQGRTQLCVHGHGWSMVYCAEVAVADGGDE